MFLNWLRRQDGGQTRAARRRNIFRRPNIELLEDRLVLANSALVGALQQYLQGTDAAALGSQLAAQTVNKIDLPVVSDTIGKAVGVDTLFSQAFTKINSDIDAGLDQNQTVANLQQDGFTLVTNTASTLELTYTRDLSTLTPTLHPATTAQDFGFGASGDYLASVNPQNLSFQKPTAALAGNFTGNRSTD